jgi:S1-C subfamily serine protease
VVAVAAVGAFLIAKPDSKPAVDRNDVSGIVDKKIEAAVGQLQAAPAPGVSVYDAVRGSLVVIQGSGAAGPNGASELGSGVIVNTSGAILTALHVVQDTTNIRVIFADGTEATAKIQSSDAEHDSAVLTADTLPQVIVPAVLGGGARIGDETFAVGNPLGFVSSLSAGVVSALGRSYRLKNGRVMEGLIQFDAAVNPGNSGGPLLNDKGQVIGIVTGLATPNGQAGSVGIGFAVPIGSAGGAAGAPSR